MRVKKEMCLALLLISFLPSEAAHAVTVRAADFGYNPVDATSALQAAIDSGADTVIVDKMAADWTIQPVFLNSSNQRIVFEDGVKVVAKAGSFHGIYDCLFLANAQSNITLSGYGATLQMRKDDYLSSDYTDSEFRMAIRLGGCTNVTIEGLTILDTGGDGVCMASWGPDRPWCENVVIRDIVCDNNYRQGISICSVKNLLVDNCIFANTNGTPPASGIDIEPDKLFERIDQVTIQNSIIHANAATNGGIQFALNNFGGEPYKDARVDINHCTIVGNSNQGMWLWDTTSGLTVRNSLFVSNTGYGVYQLYNNLGTLSVEHSAFWDNGSGATRMANVAATSVTGVDPKILSTDINHPYYMHLSADTATTISQGASDGRPMGARPVAPWSGLVLVKEHFTGDPGWIHGPDPDYAGNSFGYSATSRAGGETGEIGGTVHSIGRSIPGTPPVFYGKDLVKPLTLEDSFELNWNTEDGADYYGEQGLNSYVRFGYFDRDAITTWYPVHMGLQMGDDAIYLIYSMHETGWTQQKLLKAGISGTTGHRLRFIYDPDAGPYGRISGQYNDEPIVSMDLTSGDRVRWNVEFDTFGMFALPINPVGGGEENVHYFDNVAFTIAAPPQMVPGDANGDGAVDSEDVRILAANWQRTGVGWLGGDFNNDRRVDARDASILAANWGRVSGGEESYQAIPEPTALIGMLGVMLALSAATRGLRLRAGNPRGILDRCNG